MSGIVSPGGMHAGDAMSGIVSPGGMHAGDA